MSKAQEKPSEENIEKNIAEATALFVVTELSHEDKTVRDPIHGDIIWNHLETHVIDTQIFQRLRRIKQLGTAHFVFPGAEYSRFQHSLGTLHMAQTLLHNITENRFSQHQSFGKTKLQDMAFRLVERLAALLHDVHEFPLSHTLEKEGSIFPAQWKDKAMSVKTLGKDSEIFTAINECIFKLLSERDTVLNYIKCNAELDQHEQEVLRTLTGLEEDARKRLAQRLAKTVVTYAYRLLSGRKDKVSDMAEELFEKSEIMDNLVDEGFLIAGNQLILDTVCADLLDYLARDFYFCGIRKMYDERFLKYATITDYSPGRGRKPYPVFAYRLVSKRRQIKFSVVSSLFDVLELRYTIAELVHTNRTKNAFSAMAIESFNFYIQSLDEGEQQRFVNKMMGFGDYGFGDDELLSYIRAHDNTSKYILDYYFTHKPYHEYILWSYRNIAGDPQLENALTKHIRNPKERFYLEKLLVKWLSSSAKITKKPKDGDCLLFVMPHPKRLYKELKTNVVYLDENGNAKVETLLSLSRTDISYSPAHPTMLTLIERSISQRDNLIKKYKNLWHASLFISPRVHLPNIDAIVAELIEKFLRVVGFNISIAAPKELIPEDLHTKLLTLQTESRQYKTFEQMYKSHL